MGGFVDSNLDRVTINPKSVRDAVCWTATCLRENCTWEKTYSFATHARDCAEAHIAGHNGGGSSPA